MVGFSEGSLVANLKNWARRPSLEGTIRSEASTVRDQHLATAAAVEVEQSQRRSTVFTISIAANRSRKISKIL